MPPAAAERHGAADLVRGGLDPYHRGDGRHGAAGVARATVSIPATAAMGGAGGLAGDPLHTVMPCYRPLPAKSATSSTTAPSAIAAAWSTWCAAASIPATAATGGAGGLAGDPPRAARPRWRAPRR